MDVWYRLRHLHTISCRDLGVCESDMKNSYVFFALSSAESESLGYFFKSSKSNNIMNPDWDGLDFSFSKMKSFSFLNEFILTVFLSRKNKNRIICELKIHITGLVPVDRTNISMEYNQRIYFNFNNSWFCLPIKSLNFPVEPIDLDLQPRIKNSKLMYNRETIQRLIEHNKRKYVSQSNVQLIDDISSFKDKYENLNQLKQKIYFNENLRDSLLKSKNRKEEILAEILKKIEVLETKSNKVQENSEKLDTEIIRVNTVIKKLTSMSDKISHEYMLRMYQLIKELSRIYPITPTISPGNISSNSTETLSNIASQQVIKIKSTDKLSICGLYLPIYEQDNQSDLDPTTFGALSMVFRFLIALSQIYNYPLRYPLIYDGPRMIVRDEIINLDERDFYICKHSSSPLYKLKYASYLMNVNIVAIRGYLGLQTKFNERTLWNISTLIEGRTLRSSIPTNPSSSFLTNSNSSPVKSQSSVNTTSS